MDHTEAVRIQAVEKYILGELSPRLRDEFEEHYFDCVDCAVNLRAGVAFAAASRRYFAESPVPAKVVEVPRTPWFGWLKPLIAVPAFAVMLFVILYQNSVSIPRLKQAGSSVSVSPWFSLRATNVRGAAGEKFEIRPGQGVSLFVDITSVVGSTDSGFLLQLKDSGGKLIGSSSVSAAEARRPVLFSVPPGIQEGQYVLVVVDQSGASAKESSRLPFAIAFSPRIEQH